MIAKTENKLQALKLFSPMTLKRRGNGSLGKKSIEQMNLVLQRRILPFMDSKGIDLKNLGEVLKAGKEFLKARQEEIKGNTLRKEKSILSSFIAQNFSVNPKRIELELSEIKIPEMGTDKTEKAISFDDLKEKIDEMENPKHKLLLKASYYSGARVSEIIGLKLKDGKKSQDQKEIIFHTIGKGSKDRSIRMSLELFSEIIEVFQSKSEKNKKGILFFNPRNKEGRFTRQSLWQITNKRGFNPHQLRHSRASHLIEDGMVINAVQKLLGHSSPMTTVKFYVHTHPKTESLQKRTL